MKTAFILLITAASASAAIVVPTYDAAASTPNAFNPATELVNGSGLSSPVNGGDSLASAQAVTHLFDGNFGESYVSNDNGADYFIAGTPPVIVFDLGADTALSDLIFWQYQNNGGNGSAIGNQAYTIDVRFNTDAQGTSFAGAVDQTVTLLNTTETAGVNSAQTFSTSGNARYIELTFTDNQIGQSGITAGGDRVGLGEFRVNAVPEPSSAALLGLGGLALILRRRK